MRAFQPLILKRTRRNNLRRVLYSLELTLTGPREVCVNVPELGLSYAVPTNAHIGKLLRQNGMYEEHIVNWITGHFRLEDGGIFIDVGANFGWYSCIFARIAGAHGRVFSFEPEPANANLLLKNLELNGVRNCKLFQVAVGKQLGTETLRLAHRSNPGAHTLVKGGYCEGEVEVPVVTLDDTILPAIGTSTISLVKIDIEGFELEALRGARGVLKKTCAIILEFSPPYLERGGFDPSELWQLLAYHGFEAFRFHHETGPIRLLEQPSDICDLLLLRSPIARDALGSELLV